MKRIQCPCGKVLAIPSDGAAKFRCPACKSILRVRGSKKPKSPRAPSPRAANPETDDAGYEIVPDPEPAAAQSPNSFQPVWMPNEAVIAADAKYARARSVPAGSTYGTADLSVSAADFPGPFIDRSAVLFPFLHPTWACWIGLSFVTALALAAIGIALFFLAVIMTFGAFMSAFTFATMVIGCVALVGYVITAIEMVFEETANGGNRLARLPGLSFADNLPSFLRMAGALLTTIAVAGGIAYLVRNHLGPWETPEWKVNPILAFQLTLIFSVVAWALFPIFLISNSVEQSIWPFWALHTTVFRLAKCAGHYAVFLVVSALAWISIVVLFNLLYMVHISLPLIAAGPLLAMYLLYYAHWLGRVVRQMMADES